jgi:hypothetical protein
MGVWDDIQKLPTPTKKELKKQEKVSKEAHKQRQATQKYYDKFQVESAEIEGLIFRSRLEALWYEELKDCDSFTCFECVKVPVYIDGPYGKFLSNYEPDFHITLSDGSSIYVELKPNHKLALADDRPKRALELNPKFKFVVIGGYPYSKRGVTVRMLTGKGETVHKYVQIPEVLRFLGCE